MPRSAFGLLLAAASALLGTASGGVATAEPPPEKPANVAETLRQLRKPVHEWLARDIPEKTLAQNRAYADLVLA